MRSSKEIADYYRVRKEGDCLGDLWQGIAPFMDFETVNEFDTVPMGAEMEDFYRTRWKIAGYEKPTKKKILTTMREYTRKAWGCIDANWTITFGSMKRLSAWCWLLGDDKMADICDKELDEIRSFMSSREYSKDYPLPQFFIPVLFKVCQKYKFPMPTYGPMVKKNKEEQEVCMLSQHWLNVVLSMILPWTVYCDYWDSEDIPRMWKKEA